MAIKIEREPADLSSFPAELCCKCKKPTRFWTEGDVALCGDCAEKYEPSDIPSKEEWFKSVLGKESDFWSA